MWSTLSFFIERRRRRRRRRRRSFFSSFFHCWMEIEEEEEEEGASWGSRGTTGRRRSSSALRKGTNMFHGGHWAELSCAVRRDGENSAPFLSSFFLLASSTLLLFLLLLHSDKRCYTHTHTHAATIRWGLYLLSFSPLLSSRSLARLNLSIFSFLF